MENYKAASLRGEARRDLTGWGTARKGRQKQRWRGDVALGVPPIDTAPHVPGHCLSFPASTQGSPHLLVQLRGL